jgi:hypothetical protein
MPTPPGPTGAPLNIYQKLLTLVTPVMDGSTRSAKVTLETGTRSVLGAMLQAGLAKATGIVQATPLGQQVQNQAIRNQIAALQTNPITWVVLGLITVLLLIAAFRR